MMTTIRTIRMLLFSSAVTATLSLYADVWSTARIKIGTALDLNSNGLIDKGEVIDSLHAADMSHANHSSSAKRNRADLPEDYREDLIILNCEVNCVSEGVVRNQDCIYLTQSMKVNTTTTPWTTNVAPQKLDLPFAATSDHYSAVVRFRRDMTTSLASQVFLNLGYEWSDGGAERPNGSGIMMFLDHEGYPSVQVGHGNVKLGHKNWVVDPTVDPNIQYSRYYDGTWVDCGVVVDGRRIRVYWSPETGPCRWFDIDTTDTTKYPADVTNLSRMYPDPYYKVSFGGENAKNAPPYDYATSGDWSKNLRGALALLGFWDRSLSDAEIVEALSNGGPAVFRVGVEGRNGEHCGGGAADQVASVNPASFDTRNVPATLLAGGGLDVSFAIPARIAGLNQFLRIKPSATSGAGKVDMYVDGVRIGEGIDFCAGNWSDVFVKGAMLSEGVHAAKVVCTSGTLQWDLFEMIGSFSHQPGLSCGTDKYTQYNKDLCFFGGKEGLSISDAQAGDAGWFDYLYFPMPPVVNSDASYAARPFRLHWTPHQGMPADSRFTLRIKSRSATKTAWTVKINDKILLSGETWGADKVVEVPFTAADLTDGDNVIALYSDVDQPNYDGGLWVNEVGIICGKPRSGLLLFVR